MREVRIEGSFEIPTQETWDKYLHSSMYDNLRIQLEDLGLSSQSEISLLLEYPKLPEKLFQHNNAVGSLSILHAICRHYFDQGIPDDPYYISPGNDGQSVQYMPNFRDEHWMRHHWFCLFADMYYLKLFAVWDSVLEILNEFYTVGKIVNSRFPSEMRTWLNVNQQAIYGVFVDIFDSEIYKQGHKIRTAAAHSVNLSTVQNSVVVERNVETEVPARATDGKVIWLEDGTLAMKTVKGISVSVRIGDYTPVSAIVENIQSLTTYSGEKILEIVSLMRASNGVKQDE